MQHLLEESKATFVDNIATDGTSTRKYFAAVKTLGSASASNAEWSVSNLFPGDSPEEAGEKAAEYFTRITDMFQPLEPCRADTINVRTMLTDEEVTTLLKKAKKPNSTVEGDLPPVVVRTYHHLMTTPVKRIFNAVLSRGMWPEVWKVETTVVIPKTAAPASLAECRNISCTPFLSKVLEGVVLADLRQEIPVDESQYGGEKGCSVDHLLMDLLDRVLEPLEMGDPSLVLGIDIEKAFNRLDHSKCLAQLQLLGASTHSLQLVRSFLTGRSMGVKVGDRLGSRKTLSGGSSQGSILGPFLYCAATRQLCATLPRTANQERRETTSPQSSPERGGNEGAGFELMDQHDVSPVSSTDSFVTAGDTTPASEEELQDDKGKLGTFKYIDDSTVTERVDIGAVVRHIEARSSTEHVPATELEALMRAVVTRADEIGAKVNGKKTQLMCISPDNGYVSGSEVKVAGENITSQDTMLLLGYMLGTAPGATAQVEFLKKKFRAKFWTLIHLRKAGIKGDKLFKLYAVLVRPVLETNCVVFHSMLTVTQREELERLQKQVLRLCYGYKQSCASHCREHGIEKLQLRRENRIKKFVAKTIETNPRFANKWFVRRPVVETELRRRKPYVEKRARTERYRKSPLVHLQRVANEIHA